MCVSGTGSVLARVPAAASHATYCPVEVFRLHMASVRVPQSVCGLWLVLLVVPVKALQ